MFVGFAKGGSQDGKHIASEHALIKVFETPPFTAFGMSARGDQKTVLIHGCYEWDNMAQGWKWMDCGAGIAT